MGKLKRNGIIEKGLVFQKIFSSTEETYFEKFIDRVVENYKKSNEDKLFTVEETDAIMQALKSMPGYTPGRFYHSLRVLNDKGNITEASLAWNLLFAYTMLSITNPELFEEESDRIMKCDRCGALNNESRFVTFRAENDPSWRRINLCMECSTWLRRMLEDAEEKV